MGAVERAWDVHVVCLRTKSPLFTCSGHGGGLVLAVYAPGNDIVGFLKQKHGQQQAILGMGTKGGSHMQLDVIYDSQVALDNISPAPNNQYVAFHESDADTGCGVIVCADTKAICYRTAAYHLHDCEVSWWAAWSADSKWVIWYVSMTRNRLRSPCLLVNVATWHETQLFSTADSICRVVWNRDVCSVVAQTCDSRFRNDVLLLSFVRLPQTMTSLFDDNHWYNCKFVTSLCQFADRWTLTLFAGLLLLPLLFMCIPLWVIYALIRLWRHL